MDCLREAVSAWFESCLDRGVLEKALGEVGFRPAGANENIPVDASMIELGPQRPAEHVEVSVPAYIAATIA